MSGLCLRWRCGASQGAYKAFATCRQSALAVDLVWEGATWLTQLPQPPHLGPMARIYS